MKPAILILEELTHTTQLRRLPEAIHQHTVEHETVHMRWYMLAFYPERPGYKARYMYKQLAIKL